MVESSRKNPLALPALTAPSFHLFLRQLLIEAFDLYSFYETSQSSGYTLLGRTSCEVCVLTGGSLHTVNMPTNPKAGQRYTVVRKGTGAVTLDGNTRNINGSSTASLASQGDTLSLIYSAEADEYFTA